MVGRQAGRQRLLGLPTDSEDSRGVGVGGRDSVKRLQSLGSPRVHGLWGPDLEEQRRRQRHARGAPQMWARTWAKRMYPCSQVPGRAGEEAGAQGRAGWGGRSAGCSPRASPIPGSFYHELLGGE